MLSLLFLTFIIATKAIGVDQIGSQGFRYTQTGQQILTTSTMDFSSKSKKPKWTVTYNRDTKQQPHIAMVSIGSM